VRRWRGAKFILAETGFGGNAPVMGGKTVQRNAAPAHDSRTMSAGSTPGRGTDRVTIDDVAGALGLAKGTVSRALNGYTDIAEATRARVQRMAKQMGYLPLAHAQAIRTGRLRSLGLVLQIGEPDAQRPFLADFLAGLTEAASAEAWTLTVATAQTEAETRQVIARLAAERKADGFILPRTETRDARIAFLRRAGVPFVLFGRTGDDTGCAWFDILGEDAMALAVRRLHGLGHRRIGFVGAGAQYHYNRLRLDGYRAALSALGLGQDPTLEAGGAVTAEAGEEAAAALLSAPLPPTGLVCATDMAALGACRAVTRLGLRVGREVSVIGYDGIPEGAWADPPLTTFEVDNRAAGARLASLLIRRICGTPPEALRQTAPARLCLRGSDGPPALGPEALAARIAATNAPAGALRKGAAGELERQ
jgi:LacI family transcriptional regulator